MAFIIRSLPPRAAEPIPSKWPARHWPARHLGQAGRSSRLQVKPLTDLGEPLLWILLLSVSCR